MQEVTISPMQHEPEVLANAPRCLARTRSGETVPIAGSPGKRRCRMHGGNNPGAPRGNRNALKHGLRTAEMAALQRMLRDTL